MPLWFHRSPPEGPYLRTTHYDANPYDNHNGNREGDLVLRPFDMTDAHDFSTSITELMTQPEMSAFLLTFPNPFTPNHARKRIRETQSWLRKGQGWSLAVEWQGQMVGQAQIICSRPRYRRGEVAYWIAPMFQRRGLARAAMDLLIKAACDYWPLDQVEATVAPENTASIHLLHHLGFTYRELAQVPYRVQGEWRQRRAQVDVYGRSARLTR